MFNGRLWIAILFCWTSPSFALLKAQEIDLALLSRFTAALRHMDIAQQDFSFRVKCTVEQQVSAATLSIDYSDVVLKKLRSQGVKPANQQLTYEYVLNGKLLLSVKPLKEGAQEISGTNERYAFRILERPSLDRPSLLSVSQHGEDQTVDAFVLAQTATAHSLVPGLWSVFSIPLPTLVADESFKVTAISEVEYEGEQLVRVGFEHPNRTEEIRLRLANGYFVCDPGKLWAIREYGAAFENDAGTAVAEQRALVTLGTTANGLPYASDVNLTVNWLDSNKRQDLTLWHSEILEEDVSQEVFYLSHYGLPEPKFGRSWLAWLGYAAVGLVCVFVGGYWFRKSSRASRNS